MKENEMKNIESVAKLIASAVLKYLIIFIDIYLICLCFKQQFSLLTAIGFCLITCLLRHMLKRNVYIIYYNKEI